MSVTESEVLQVEEFEAVETNESEADEVSDVVTDGDRITDAEA